MASLDIDTDFVARLAELLQRTGLTEIEISQGDTRVRVAKQVQTVVEYVAAPGGGGGHAGSHHGGALAPLAVQPGPAPAAGAAAEALHPGAITSPMVGTAYLASEPGSPPFVGVGEAVKEGQTLLIIEAMKVMNAIRAPRAGRVARIYVENASPVEYGEPLMALE
jgi:acetyl-CoA carboxylase biotin carboxyl carrier protein